MKETKPRCAPDGASAPRPPETAALQTRPRELEAFEKVGAPACQSARPSNNAALSSKTSSRSVGGFLVKTQVFIAAIAFGLKADAAEGRLTSTELATEMAAVVQQNVGSRVIKPVP